MSISRIVSSVAAGAFVLGSLALPALASPRGSLTWSGSVDNTAIVSLHGTQAYTRTVDGLQARVYSERVIGSLPRRRAHVYLAEVNGGGNVEIVQQPDATDNFTARVRIHDPQAGSGHYHFVLSWRAGLPNGRVGMMRHPRVF